MLGRLYKANNQPAKAEAIFEKILSANPDSRNVLVNLTQLYYDQGDYQKVIALLGSIPDNKMDPSLLYLLGGSYQQSAISARPRKSFQEALKREPDNQDIRRAYAEALMAHGKMQDARDQLQAIVKVIPRISSPISAWDSSTVKWAEV